MSRKAPQSTSASRRDRRRARRATCKVPANKHVGALHGVPPGTEGSGTGAAAGRPDSPWNPVCGGARRTASHRWGQVLGTGRRRVRLVTRQCRCHPWQPVQLRLLSRASTGAGDAGRGDGVFDPVTMGPAGEIVVIDGVEGRLQLRRGPKLGDVRLPAGLIPGGAGRGSDTSPSSTRATPPRRRRRRIRIEIERLLGGRGNGADQGGRRRR